MSYAKVTTHWVGTFTGTNRGRLKIRIVQKGERITSQILLEDFTFGSMLILGRGVHNSNHWTIDLFSFIPDRPTISRPVTGKADISISSDPNRAEGVWGTDLGTKGSLIIYRATFSQRFSISLPSWLHSARLRLESFLRRSIKWFYLLGLASLSVLSLLGAIKEISIAALIMLVIPAVFLLRYEIRDFFAISGITKLWGMEVQQQVPSPPPTITAATSPVSSSLDPVTRYLLSLSQFLVPRTKAILQVLAGLGRPFSSAEFEAIAKQLGVPHDNIQLTMAALQQSGCIVGDENDNLQVSPFGKTYLQFEASFRH